MLRRIDTSHECIQLYENVMHDKNVHTLSMCVHIWMKECNVINRCIFFCFLRNVISRIYERAHTHDCTCGSSELNFCESILRNCYLPLVHPAPHVVSSLYILPIATSVVCTSY